MADGTAANICAMVFGNMGDDCATGVAFTRNPGTGDDQMFGEAGNDIIRGNALIELLVIAIVCGLSMRAAPHQKISAYRRAKRRIT